LKRNQVVECVAVIGDWLQIRYEKEDCVWVMWRRDPSTRDIESGDNVEKHFVINTHSEKKHDDLNFKDDRLKYEIDGKFLTVNLTSDTKITRRRVQMFDQIRHGQRPHEELLVLLPHTLSDRVLEKYLALKKEKYDALDSPTKRLLGRQLDQQKVYNSPLTLNQQDLFDYVMDNIDISYDEEEEDPFFHKRFNGDSSGVSIVDEMYVNMTVAEDLSVDETNSDIYVHEDDYPSI
jgi:hypothetical protein